MVQGSPLERTRRKRVQRNVAIAMGNSGEQRFVAQLEEWVKGEDEVLAETAAWAVEAVLERVRVRMRGSGFYLLASGIDWSG